MSRRSQSWSRGPPARHWSQETGRTTFLEIAAARCDLWIGARGDLWEDPAYNVSPAVAGRYRATLQRVGAQSVGQSNGRVIFVIDGFADNIRGVVYVIEGAAPPPPGRIFAFGQLAQLVPLSRPGWYFFATS